jgi:multicomponent Na+:H+ antiporter subunit G
MSESAAYVFIAIGCLFDLLGAIGLVRLPDLYNRLQAATKCVTLGTCMILFGIFLYLGFNAGGIKALICAVFVLITSPTAAHALARGSHRGGIPLWKNSLMDKYAEDKEGEAIKQ